jgi:hypothetical protein
VGEKIKCHRVVESDVETQAQNCLIKNNILHKGHTEVKNEKTAYVMARDGKWEQKCYPLPLPSPSLQPV